MRGGVIERVVDLASGRDDGSVIAPAARRIDATGLHAVPAFIDAFTYAGAGSAPSSRNAGQRPDEGDGPPAASMRGRRDGLTPEWCVLDALDVNAQATAALRKSGFGAINVAPRGGFLSGQCALVTVTDRALRDRVVLERSGYAASLSARTSGYPRSLMGAFAHLRQAFLDSGHLSRWKALWEEDPLGLERPPRDTTLEAIASIRAGAAPLCFTADSDNAILRGLRLAGELGVDVVIAGGREAARVVPQLSRARARVILVADDAEEPKRESKPGSPPPRVQEERHARWLERARTAATLADAGIPFAWGSGEKTPAALVKSIRQAIAHGVDAGIALRGLTLGAAELLGAARTLGSIEEGKSAGLALLDRPFEDADARVRYLVVDGELFELEPRKEKDRGEKKEESQSKESKEPKEPEKPSEEPGEPPEKEEQTPLVEDPSNPLHECELDADRRPARRTGGDLVISGGTVITLAGPVLERASIRIRGGRIEAVGRDVEADGIEHVVDATGWFVMPGIIDCHSHMAIDGGVNEGSESVTCEVRIRDVVDPRDVAIYRALAGGVTAAHLLHGSANTIGGQCALIKLKYGRPREELLVQGVPQTVKFALGENVKRSNFSGRSRRFPATRMGVEATLRRAFTAAREYERALQRHADRLARGERSVEPRRDLRLEALLRVLRGDIRVHSHCYRADEILMLLRVASEFGFGVSTLQHVLEGYKVAPEIARHGAGASTFSDWWAYKIEAFDAIPHNAALMARAGVVVSINSDSNEEVRHLNREAAKAVRHGGIDEQEALAMVTRNAARQLHAEHRLGTIEPGKDADLAIFDAHPLSVYARCRVTVVEGEIYFERGGERENPHAGRPLSPPRDGVPDRPVENAAGLFAVRGARIVPVDREPIDPGSVVIAGGRVRAVGPVDDVAIPPGATVIEGEGLEVYPGFIDAGSYLGLTEINSVRGTVDLGETGSVHPDLVTATAVNVHSEIIPTTRAHGITTTAVFNSGGLISGQVGVIRLRGTSTPEAVISRSCGLQVNLPSVQPDRKEDPAAVKELRRWFERARRYAEASEEVDLRLAALLPFVRKERPVIFTARTEAQIRLALELAEELDVRAVVRDGLEAWRVASLLAEKKVPVITGPVETLPARSYDPYDAPYRSAGRLHAAGVPIAFQSSHASQSRNLPFNAGVAVAHGLPRAAALHALTLGAAEILGIAGERGSITPGKAADLIITDGDPLEITTHVVHVFIDGHPVPLENRHTRLYERFRTRERRESAEF